MSTQFGETVEVGIVTNNLDAMRHFYGELLALPLEGRLEFPGGSMERYRVGGNIIKLVNYGDDPPAKGVPGGGYAACGYRYFSLAANDLTATVALLKAAGTDIALDVTPFGGGIGFAFVCDPDGNWIELFGAC